MTNLTPPKPNTQPTTPEAPKAEPSPLAVSVTVKAGIVAVRQWMAEGKNQKPPVFDRHFIHVKKPHPPVKCF